MLKNETCLKEHFSNLVSSAAEDGGGFQRDGPIRFSQRSQKQGEPTQHGNMFSFLLRHTESPNVEHDDTEIYCSNLSLGRDDTRVKLQKQRGGGGVINIFYCFLEIMRFFGRSGALY